MRNSDYFARLKILKTKLDESGQQNMAPGEFVEFISELGDVCSAHLEKWSQSFDGLQDLPMRDARIIAHEIELDLFIKCFNGSKAQESLAAAI